MKKILAILLAVSILAVEIVDSAMIVAASSEDKVDVFSEGDEIKELSVQETDEEVTDDLAHIENIQEAEAVNKDESLENNENTGADEDIEDAKDTENTEDDSGNENAVEPVDAVENTDNTESADDLGNENVVESIDTVENTDNAESTDEIDITGEITETNEAENIIESDEEEGVDYDYTGFIEEKEEVLYVPEGIILHDGTWCYVRNGRCDTSYTGLAQNENGWWYIRKGEVDFGCTDVVPYNGNWWYVKNGKLRFDYTGVAQNENGWWYIRNGKLDWGYTGVARNQNGWWRIEKGKVNFSYTGLAQNENGWWRIEKGKVNFGYTGLAQNENGWWYVRDGKLDWDYNGVVPYRGKWFCVRKGRLDWNYTGVARNMNGWWRIEKGVVNFNYTGLAQNENGWWYIRNGKLDWNYTGVVLYNGGWFCVRSGKLDWGYNGIARNENGWWKIDTGKVDFAYTGVARNENGWWYVHTGKVDFAYTGIASNENGWWYIRNGKLDWSYNGTVNHNGKQYMVKNGSVVINIQKFSLVECRAADYLGDQMAVILTARHNEELEKLYNVYYIVMLNSAGTAIIDTYDSDCVSSDFLQVSAVIRSSDAFKTVMMSKYAIAVKRGNGYEIISDMCFLNNPDITASMTKTYLGYYDSDKITSKKGIQGASTGYTESSGAQHILLNVDLADMVSTGARSGYVPYTYKGKTYYFQDMIALAQTIRYLNGWDNDNPYGWHNRSVTVVLLLGWKDDLAYLIHPEARHRGAAPYYAFNMKEENARNTYEALFCYMGEKLGENKCRVSNWTLGNEVNSCRAWSYSSDMPLRECVENYAQAFQLLYQGVKRTSATSRVFMSLDHCWNMADAGHNGKEYLDEFAAYMNRTASFMQWNVNYHPYSQPLTRTDFWNDSTNTENTINTAYISMKNIQVLTDYLSDLEKRYEKAGGSIRVILGEIGYSGYQGNDNSEAEQAAALGYGYYIAMFNLRIDAYIIRAYLDDSAETQSGLYFGLMNKQHEKKQSFDLYRNLDTQDSLTYMNRYQAMLGISSWERAIPGFDAKKLPAIDF